jgi:hypothetical protein
MNTFNPGMNPMQYADINNKKPQMNNPLTDEEKKLLQKNNNQFNLMIQPIEIARAVCTHKDPQTGTFTTVVNADGSLTCKQCGARIYPDLVTPTYVKQAKEMILNVLQTTKLIAVDMNNDVTRAYYSMIPYIERIEALYDMVCAGFRQYSQNNPVTTEPNNSMFAMYNNLINPSVPFMNQMGNYGYTMQQNQMVNGGNPFYQQTPAPMYPPQQTVPVYPPQQTVVPVPTPMYPPQQTAATTPVPAAAPATEAPVTIKEQVQL